MKLTLCVEVESSCFCFDFLSYRDSSRIELDGHFIIDLYKHHNHSYSFKAFFYNSKRIYSRIYCQSKSKLFGAVQELLQQELYHVHQF